MANANLTQTFDVDINKVYSVLSDFSKYPKFMDGVTSVEVIEENGSEIKAKYNLNLIKKFSYTMNHTLSEPTKIQWSLESGDLLKRSEGSWTLKDLGEGKTEVSYNLDVDFKVMVPSMISNKLIKSNLPSMMKAVEKEAKAL